MDKSIRSYFLVFIVFTLVPLLVIFPLSLLQFFNDNSSVLASISLFSLLPLATYYFLSRKAIQENDDFSIILRITFYVNFLIYMFAILVAFYFLIIGGFLFAGQTPIGLDLEQWQALYLVGIGIYLITISAFGMIYLSKTKKTLST